MSEETLVPLSAFEDLLEKHTRREQFYYGERVTLSSGILYDFTKFKKHWEGRNGRLEKEIEERA